MPLPETILQFGAGRFLRAFVDRFVQHANDGGQAVGSIVVVQSTPGARAELLNAQPDGYHVLIRGYEKGQVIDRVEVIRSVSRALTAEGQWDQVLAVARSADLRYILSNATEAGYALDPSDKVDSSPPKTTPAKLTRVLWERFQAGGSPLVLLPCELFERNAAKLRDLVLGLARAWSLPDDFLGYAGEACLWPNSLVDCIVTRAPEDNPLTAQDPLLICAEPYALWAVERPAGREVPLFTDPALHVVDDVMPFFLRKVRILNGLHTAMTAKYLPLGFQTVRQVVEDREASRWLRDLLFEEIVPTVAQRVEGAAAFADDTWDRFRNPFQVHRLTDIAVNHADKVRVRLKPTYEEYERLLGHPPRRLSEILALPLPV